MSALPRVSRPPQTLLCPSFPGSAGLRRPCCVLPSQGQPASADPVVSALPRVSRPPQTLLCPLFPESAGLHRPCCSSQDQPASADPVVSSLPRVSRPPQTLLCLFFPGSAGLRRPCCVCSSQDQPDSTDPVVSALPRISQTPQTLLCLLFPGSARLHRPCCVCSSQDQPDSTDPVVSSLPRVSRPPQNLDELGDSLQLWEQLNGEQTQIQARFRPLTEQFEIMAKYEVTIPADVQIIFDNLHADWLHFQQALIDGDIMLKKHKVGRRLGGALCRPPRHLASLYLPTLYEGGR